MSAEGDPGADARRRAARTADAAEHRGTRADASVLAAWPCSRRSSRSSWSAEPSPSPSCSRRPRQRALEAARAETGVIQAQQIEYSPGRAAATAVKDTEEAITVVGTTDLRWADAFRRHHGGVAGGDDDRPGRRRGEGAVGGAALSGGGSAAWSARGDDHADALERQRAGSSGGLPTVVGHGARSSPTSTSTRRRERSTRGASSPSIELTLDSTVLTGRYASDKLEELLDRDSVQAVVTARELSMSMSEPSSSHARRPDRRRRRGRDARRRGSDRPMRPTRMARTTRPAKGAGSEERHEIDRTSGSDRGRRGRRARLVPRGSRHCWRRRRSPTASVTRCGAERRAACRVGRVEGAVREHRRVPRTSRAAQRADPGRGPPRGVLRRRQRLRRECGRDRRSNRSPRATRSPTRWPRQRTASSCCPGHRCSRSLFASRSKSNWRRRPTELSFLTCLQEQWTRTIAITSFQVSAAEKRWHLTLGVSLPGDRPGVDPGTSRRSVRRWHGRRNRPRPSKASPRGVCGVDGIRDPNADASDHADAGTVAPYDHRRPRPPRRGRRCYSALTLRRVTRTTTIDRVCAYRARFPLPS